MSWKATKTYTAAIPVYVEIPQSLVGTIEYMFRDARANDEPRPIIHAIKLLRERTAIELHDGSTRILSLKDAKEIVEDIFAAL